MNRFNADRPDVSICCSVVGGVLMGGVMMPFVQADLAGISDGRAIQISLISGLLLALTGLLWVGLLDVLRPPVIYRGRPLSWCGAQNLPPLAAKRSDAD